MSSCSPADRVFVKIRLKDGRCKHLELLRFLFYNKDFEKQVRAKVNYTNAPALEDMSDTAELLSEDNGFKRKLSDMEGSIFCNVELHKRATCNSVNGFKVYPKSLLSWRTCEIFEVFFGHLVQCISSEKMKRYRVLSEDGKNQKRECQCMKFNISNVRLSITSPSLSFLGMN